MIINFYTPVVINLKVVNMCLYLLVQYSSLVQK